MMDVVKRVAVVAFVLLSLAYLSHVFGTTSGYEVGSNVPAGAVGGHWTVYK